MIHLLRCALLLALMGSATGVAFAEPVCIVVAADFDEDLAAFEDALIDWEDCLAATEDRQEQRALRRAHPAADFADRMRAHAAAGELRAADWLLEYMRKLDLRRGEREKLRLELYDLLLEADAARDLRESTLKRVFSDAKLKHAVGLAGLEKIVERFLLREEDSDLRGRAWLGLASKYSTSREETDVARAVEILEGLLTPEPASAEGGTAAPAVTLSGKDRKEAESLLFALKHLRIGGIAPDFTGKTIDGETVSLSDHRGEVTVLSFFGFW